MGSEEIGTSAAARRLSQTDPVTDPREPKRQKLDAENATTESFRCEECDRTFKSKRALLRHLRENKRHIDSSSNVGKLFTCRQEGCNTTFVRAYDRQRHEKNKHSGTKTECATYDNGDTSDIDHDDEVEKASSDVQSKLTTLIPVPQIRMDETLNEHRVIESAPGSCQPVDCKRILRLPHDGGIDTTNQEAIRPPKSKDWWKSGQKLPVIPCGLCRTPFQHDDPEGLSMHLKDHMNGFQNGYRCDICQINFVNKADLRAHEVSAQSGDCGFAFFHKGTCKGHHPPSGTNGTDESDRFDFCYRLLNWEQSQLRTYKSSIASLSAATAAGVPRWACTAGSELTISRFDVNVQIRAWGTADGILLQSFNKLSLAEDQPSDRFGQQGKPFKDASILPQDVSGLKQLEISPQDLLCRSACAGNISTVRNLIDHGYDVNGPDTRGYMPLHYASMGGLEEITRLLIDFGADVERISDSGVTSLGTAILCGHENVVRVLLENSVLVNDIDPMLRMTPLHHAVRNGDLSLARIFLDFGAEVNTADNEVGTPLHSAVISHHTFMIDLLLEYGVNINSLDGHGSSPLQVAMTSKRHDIVRQLLDHGGCITEEDASWGLLSDAIQSGADLHLVGRLIDAGALVNKEGMFRSRPFFGTPIMLAMMNDDHKMVDFLLSSGANLDVRLKLGDTPRSCLLKGKIPVGPEMRRKMLQFMTTNAEAAGRNVLCEVAKCSDDIKDIQSLIEAGCDVNARDNEGRTALDIVVSNPMLSQAIPILLNAGANINALDVNLRSALHQAVSHWGNIKNVQTLLSSGADIEATDSLLRSPLINAIQESGDLEIVNALITAGVNVLRRDLDGASPLHYAVCPVRGATVRVFNAMHMRDIAKALIVAGAEVNAKDASGLSVLGWAVRSKRNLAIVKLLWDAGADLDGCDINALCSNILGRREGLHDSVR